MNESNECTHTHKHTLDVLLQRKSFEFALRRKPRPGMLSADKTATTLTHICIFMAYKIRIEFVKH